MLADRSNLSPLVNVPKAKRPKKRVRAVNPDRAREKREYNRLKAEYLLAHPWDQIEIARYGLDEDQVIELGKRCEVIVDLGAFIIFRADQIHHRNKSRRFRLTDTRWWMATTHASHEYVENHKDWAREHGFLLPIQADADGRWGDGLRALETPEFMKARAGK